ncbi:MAG: ferredoxin, partial [Afipia sp.]|nr:ferredoxin [Afipia sp.]
MHLLVTDHDGREHQLEALEGWRVMEVIRDWGLPIKAECGGAC